MVLLMQIYILFHITLKLIACFSKIFFNYFLKLNCTYYVMENTQEDHSKKVNYKLNIFKYGIKLSVINKLMGLNH